MSTSANPKRKRQWKGPPRQGPAFPQAATVGATSAYEQGADGAQRRAPAFPRAVATTRERDAGCVDGSASNAARSGNDAECVDGS
jgi:hypothetical protein